ncbi:MAG: tagaturonate reductase [Succinivibrionaceae bacterium]|nr:tagaturonate reductase [Succinivibrionaceae bacterium]
MDKLSLNLRPELRSDLPVRALQFGEGNFLRGYIDWMLQKLNQKGLFNGRVVALQNTSRGQVVPKLKAQDCLYTTILHGVKADGSEEREVEVMNVIADALSPFTEWDKVVAAAKGADLRFVFSNTTEAGIVYKQEPLTGASPETFPARLAALLNERCKAGLDGLLIVPCELIEGNGDKLREIVLKHGKDWNLGDAFASYVKDKCRFVNTLVDRVVSGYPKDTFAEVEQELGYSDALLDCGETFGFMAIEGGPEIEEELPFSKIGLNVVVAPDITPYRLRKVRILNGAHTSNVPAAFLAGLDTVDQMMDHKVTGKFARSVIYDEIIPAVNLDRAMLTSFADAVVARFSDPTMHHQLASILMNCSSKVKARVVPSILDARSKGQLPRKLCFALAAYIALYRHAHGDKVEVQRAGGKTGSFGDDAYAISALEKAWTFYGEKGTEASAQLVVKSVLSDTKLWDRDLSSDVDLLSTTAKLLHAIISDGIEPTMNALMG